MKDLQDFRPEISAIQLQCMVTLQCYCWSKLQQQQQQKRSMNVAAISSHPPTHSSLHMPPIGITAIL